MDVSAAKQCKHLKTDGSPCRTPPRRGGDFCVWHDPDRVAERAALRKRGGQARHGRTLEPGEEVRLRSASDVLALVERAAGDAFALENSVARVRAIAALASVAVKVLEISEFEERLKALEQKVGVR